MNYKRIIFLITFAFFAGFAAKISLGQAPVVSINFNASSLTPGSTISVPIVLTGTTVGSYAFIINYDRDVLTYNSGVYTGPAYGIAGAPNNNFSYNGQLYLKAALAYSTTSGPATGATYTADTVFMLTFTFNGGITQFTFINISTATTQSGSTYTFVKANPYNVINLQTVFNPGIASGSALNLTSVAAGGDWSTSSTWQENAGGGTKTPNAAYNVIITANPVTIAPASNAAKCYNLTINSGGKLTLNSGKTLTTTGVFTINSNGSFVDQNATSALNAIVKRTITGNYTGSGTAGPGTIWHYVSSPVSNGVIGTFMYCLLNKWTETASTWDTLCLPVTLPLETGRGYSVAATPYFGTAIFNGSLNTGDITKSNLTNSDPAYPTYVNNYGYHLLGNPYPSALKWDANITRTNVDAAIYLWNGSTYISKLPTDNYEIQSIQGFFVHANASGGSVVLKNSNRVHNSGTFLKNAVENQLILTAAGNNLSDETSIRFSGNATTGFDGEYDALKLFGIYTCPQIYSMLPDNNLSINTLPDLNSPPVVPVGFKAGITGTFTITASGLETFTPGTEFYLTDLITGNVQNLSSNPVYNFTAYPSDPEHRFNLHFAPVGIERIGGHPSVKIYSFEKDVYVNISDDLKGNIVIYDLMGKEISRKMIESKSLNTIKLDEPQGCYLVKVVTDKLTVSEKVVIR